ncbi:MAG: ribosome maturation factor RimM [Thermoleophilaceae bacterium]
MTLVGAGRVGRRHGRDGSFYVEAPAHALPEGTMVVVAGERRRVRRRAGTAQQPLLHLEGVEDREAAAALRGETLLVEQELGADEWLASELAGCRVEGIGEVVRVIAAPSCSLLELEDGMLVPFVSDAIESVDTEARRIRVKSDFMGGS